MVKSTVLFMLAFCSVSDPGRLEPCVPGCCDDVSITIKNASVPNNTTYISADGSFQATAIVTYGMEVSTDNGATWTNKVQDFKFILSMGTWSGRTTDLAKGTYWLRVWIQAKAGGTKKYSNVMKDLVAPGL